MDKAKKNKIWRRLSEGRSLADVGVAVRDGRYDLTGISVETPKIIRTTQTPTGNVAKISGITKIERARWTRLDFTSAKLAHLLFLGCSIEDCVFDQSCCSDWGVWNTEFIRCSFRGTDLKDSALGAVDDFGRRNRFVEVDFSAADMRRTVWQAAQMNGCAFHDTKLDRVDFGTTVFVDCIFSGELRETIFSRKGFRGERFPPNDMERVNLSRASLRLVEFRGTSLDTAILPSGDDHIVIENLEEVLARLIPLVAAQQRVGWRSVRILLESMKKWAGAGQKRNVLSKSDIVEQVGPDGLSQFLQLLSKAVHGSKSQIDGRKQVD